MVLAYVTISPSSATPTPTPTTLAEPLRQRLTHLSKLHTGKCRVLLGIVGIPGSGKTTIAYKATLSQTALIQMDGFHIPRDQLTPIGLQRRGAPFTFDKPAFIECLNKLKRGERVRVPRFDHSVKDPVEGELIHDGCRVCIVEGNYLLHWPDVRELMEETWFVDVEMKTAMTRVLRRLISDIGFDVETAKERMRGNDALNAKLVLESRKFADFVIDSTNANVTNLGEKKLFL